jgi:CRP-like cAMP-binding protein
MKDLKQAQIAGTKLFSNCSAEDVEWIARTSDTVDAGAGSVLAIEGRTVREFIVVLDGVVSGGDVLFGRGSYFGETGLLDGKPHGATIEALSDARLLVFGPREFRALLRRVPSVAEVLRSSAAAAPCPADRSRRSEVRPPSRGRPRWRSVA